MFGYKRKRKNSKRIIKEGAVRPTSDPTGPPPTSLTVGNPGKYSSSNKAPVKRVIKEGDIKPTSDPVGPPPSKLTVGKAN